MKTLLLLPVIAMICLASGCASSLPKDLYVRDGEIVVNTPWGPSTVKGGILATGKAGIEAALESARLANGMPGPVTTPIKKEVALPPTNVRVSP